MFQSTHPCGVRRAYPCSALTRCSFNPRTRVGCDKIPFDNLRNFPFQSTHPCGVRPHGGIDFKMPVGFNPRTRVGCDVTHDINRNSKGVFQSTHPCGVRQSYSHALHWLQVFQSTHPCGVRLDNDVIADCVVMFQSTHPCGVRHRCVAHLMGACCFNPRTRVGCDGMG